jgi:glutathione S-transferase
MADSFKIFGAEESPYSVKVRSYFRYKGIPHQWTPRSMETMAEYQKYARLPIVPVVVTPEDEALQDSTPILEAIESRFPTPATHPPSVALRFISELLEEFGDEWGNKWMFHYRWAREVDQISAAERIVATMLPGADEEQRKATETQIRGRMVPRIGVVGSNETTAPIIEDSFAAGLGRLASRPYLMGGRPCFADFGLWGQIYNAWTDPTAGEIVRREAPACCTWIERMLDPSDEGDFESLETLAPTLEPILREDVRLFLVWSDANATAIAAGADSLEVDLDGRRWTQTVGGPQKYHAKSLGVIRRKFAEVSGDAELRDLLDRTGCLAFLI